MFLDAERMAYSLSGCANVYWGRENVLIYLYYELVFYVWWQTLTLCYKHEFAFLPRDTLHKSAPKPMFIKCIILTNLFLF